MTLSHTYDGGALLKVRRGSVSLTQSAESGAVSTGQIVVNDKDGTKAIIGQKDYAVDESACSDPIAFRGFIAARDWGRGPERGGPARDITCTIEDSNAVLGFRICRKKEGLTAAEAGDRPAETVSQRVAWLMSSPFLDGLVIDGGRIASSDKGMPKNDCRQQFPGDILTECALAAGGWNHYVRDFGDGRELVFRDDNTSTDDTSDVRISNVIEDVNDDETGLTFYPFQDFVLHREPGVVKSVVGVSYDDGIVYEEREATADAFNGERSATATNGNVKDEAQAREAALDQVWMLRTEEDALDGTILVPASAANLLNQGDRMSAKFQHLGNTGGRNYDDWTWFRVLELTRTPLLRPAAMYELRVKLSPQEEPRVSGTIVQSTFTRSSEGGGYPTLPNPVTVGNLLVYGVSDRGTGDPPAPNTGVSQPRFGTGPWTQVPATTVKSVGDGLAFWVKEADATDREGYVSSSNANIAVWEIGVSDAAATIAALTSVDKSDQGLSLSMDIGTFTGAPSGTIGLLLCVWQDDVSVYPPGQSLPTVGAGDFTVRLFDSAYEGGWILENAPLTLIADVQWGGGDLEAVVTKSHQNVTWDTYSGIWAGLALLVEPQ